MNSFYKLNIILQWMVALLFLAPLVLLILYWSQKAFENPWLYLALVPMVPLIQFFVTPICKLTGVYTYLSPMLLVFGASDKKYDLHAGTSFDYLFVMNQIPAGITAQRTMLRYFLEGLLKIIEKIESGELDESVVVSGSSYFFSIQTANRLGFEIKSPSVAERLNVYMNLFDLFWMYSYTQGKLTFPRLNQTKKAETTGANLLSNKAYIQQMRDYLSRG